MYIWIIHQVFIISSILTSPFVLNGEFEKSRTKYLISETELSVNCPESPCAGVNSFEVNLSNTGDALGGPYPVTEFELHVWYNPDMELSNIEASMGEYAIVEPGFLLLTIGDFEANAESTFNFDIEGYGTEDYVMFEIMQEEFNPNTETTVFCPLTYEKCADVEIVKTAEPTLANVNEEFTWVLKVKNNGPDVAKNVRVYDDFFSIYSITDFPEEMGCTLTEDTNILDCRVGDMEAGDSLEIRVKCSVQFDGVKTNTALVDNDTQDPNPSNNSSEASITIEENIADISVNLTNNATDPKVGSIAGYTLTVKNLGPKDATNIKVKVDLPAYPGVVRSSFGYLANIMVPEGCDTTGNTMICTIPTLAKDAVKIFLYHGVIRIARDLRSVAERIESSPFDDGPINDFSSDDLHVIGDYSTSGGNSESGVAADPVFTFNGEYNFNEKEDLRIFGPSEIFFNRYYSSFLHQRNYTPGAFGKNWSHIYDRRLLDRGEFIEVYGYQGKVYAFEKIDDQWVILNNTVQHMLLQEGDKYLFANIKNNTIHEFNNLGQLTRLENLNGSGLDLTYLDGNLKTVSDDYDRAIEFTYNETGMVSSVKNELYEVTYEYKNDLLSKVILATGEEIYYAYDSDMQKALITERSTSSNPNGYTIQEYGESGQVIRQTTPAGGIFSFEYEGLSTFVTDPNDHTTEYIHNESGTLLSQKFANGFSHVSVFNESEQKEMVSDSDGNNSYFEYDQTSGLINKYNSDSKSGNVTYTPIEIKGLKFYKANKLTYPNNLSNEVSYDQFGNPLLFKNRNEDEIGFTYDSDGQVSSVSINGALFKQYDYNDMGLLVKTTEATGEILEFEYDVLGRLIKTTYPDGSTNQLSYDGKNRIVQTLDDLGEKAEFEYTGSDMIQKAVYNDILELKYLYNEMDQKVAEIDIKGDTLFYEYDNLGLLTSFEDRNGDIMEFEYDDFNNVIGVTRASSKNTLGYTSSGVLNSYSLPSGRKLSYDVNDENLITGISINDHLLSQISYDSNGNPIEVTMPSGQTTTIKNGGNGFLESISLSPEIEVTFQTNEIGQVTQLIDPNGGIWKETFDENFRKISEENPIGSRLDYSYNDEGRLEKISSSDLSMEIQYDLGGYMNEVTYSDGTALNYSYDEFGRLTQTQGLDLAYNISGHVIESNGMLIERDPEGHILRIIYDNNYMVDYSYNELRRVSKVNDNKGNEIVLTYDEDGNIIKNERSNGISTSFTRNDFNQYTSIVDGNEANLSSQTFQYNAAHKIIEVERSGFPYPALTNSENSFDHNAAHQLSDNEYSFTGNLLNDGENEYLWSDANELLKITSATDEISFEYDGFGNRTQRINGTQILEYTQNYGLEEPQTAIISDENEAKKYFVYLPSGNLLFHFENNTNETYFYHFDERGNTRLLSDQSGEVKSRFSYTPYGVKTEEGSSEITPFTFGGEYGTIDESKIGLYQMHKRYYDFDTKRFLSGDQDANRLDPRAINPYTYAFQDPLSFIDRTGNNSTSAAGEPLTTSRENIASTTSYLLSTALNGLEVLPKLPRLPSGTSFIGNLVDVLTGTEGPPGKAPNATRVFNGVGIALSLLSIHKTLTETADNVDKSQSHHRYSNKELYKLFSDQATQFTLLYKTGKLTYSQWQKLLTDLYQIYLESIKAQGDINNANIKFESVNGFIRSLESLVPSPVSVTDLTLNIRAGLISTFGN